MSNQPALKSLPAIIQADGKVICQGDWSLLHMKRLQAQAAKLQGKPLKFWAAINHLDSAGALILAKMLAKWQASIEGLTVEQATLLHLIQKQLPELVPAKVQPPPTGLARYGMVTVAAVKQSVAFMTFLGETLTRLGQWFIQPQRILWQALMATLERAGYQALPIIGLLSFLIGVVLAYQMGLQLRTFGANIFIVNLLGIAILREFAPLIAAIIVAGRSGSAFAAQIGTMQVNQEVDALRTLGIAPVERLVLPKVLGLIIALPLLTSWACFTGILGGMMMAKTLLGIGFSDFLHRFQEGIALKHVWIGLIKTPIFALLIACIGCFQGLQVTGSAESVGQRTTQSVVQGIFLIICCDALFSIVMSWFEL